MRSLRPNVLVFDFDGVLTDNKVYVGQDGTEMVRCNRSDGLAFDVFRKLRLRVFIISRESNPVVAARARKLQVPLIQAVTDKLDALSSLAAKEGFTLAETLFVGNDLNDFHVMKASGTSACPADSHPRIREIATYVLETKGGDGVAGEIAEKVLGIDIAEVLGPGHAKA